MLRGAGCNHSLCRQNEELIYLCPHWLPDTSRVALDGGRGMVRPGDTISAKKYSVVINLNTETDDDWLDHLSSEVIGQI